MNQVLLYQYYQQYHRTILSIAANYMGNIQEAEEVTQEVFVKLSTHLDQFQKSDPKFWLIRVGINLCLDKKRSLVRWLKFQKGLLREKQIPLNGQQRWEISQTLRDLLQKIDKRSKMVVILKHMEEMSYQEISESMGIPVGTLKSINARAISKMKDSEHNEVHHREFTGDYDDQR